MKPIINPWLFYIVDLLDGLKMLCILVVTVLVFAIGIITIIINDLWSDQEEEEKSAKRTRKILILFSILLLVVIPFIPRKETCYKMMIASQITDTNIQKAEDVIKNIDIYEKNGE